MNTTSSNHSSANSTKDTTHTPTSYNDYYHNFDMNALLAEIYGEHLDDRLNAYMACCGRHVRDGRGGGTKHSFCEASADYYNDCDLQRNAEVAIVSFFCW